MIYCPVCHAHYDDREYPNHCASCGRILERSTMLSPEQLGQLSHHTSRTNDRTLFIGMGALLPAVGLVLGGQLSWFGLIPVITGGLMAAAIRCIPYGQYRVFFLYLIPVAVTYFPQTFFFSWLMLITGAMVLSLWLNLARN